MIRQPNFRAREDIITRQALIKMWLADRLKVAG